MLVIGIITSVSVVAQEPVQRLVELSDKDFEAAMQGIGDNFLNHFDKMPRIKFVLKEDTRFYNDKGLLIALASLLHS